MEPFDVPSAGFAPALLFGDAGKIACDEIGAKGACKVWAQLAMLARIHPLARATFFNSDVHTQ